MFVFQVENLEERQLLSATNSYNVPAPSPYDNISPVLLQIASGSTSTSTTGSGATTQSSTGTTSTGSSGAVDNTASFVARDRYGRIGVKITNSNINGLQPALQALGFVVTGSRPDLNFVEGFIPQANIAALGAISGYGRIGVTPLYTALTMAGPTVNQGLGPMGVDRTLATVPGYDGTGVRIGILSDSYNSNGAILPANQNGDLPPTVQVLLEGTPGSTDEGRAMAELVHDVAPGATLLFASAFNGQASFAQQIRNLANPAIGNADIIVDDVIYFDEPMFQDGIIAQAVNDVVNFNGVSYFSAAGNGGSNSYEAVNPTFVTDTTVGPGTYLDFAPGSSVVTTNSIFLNAGESLSLELQWDDPYYTTNGVDTDIDIFIIDVSTGQVVASSTSNNIATQTPSEFVSMQTFTSGTYSVVVRLESGPAPGRLKWVDFGRHNQTFQYDTQSSTVYGHAAAAQAMAVAAAPYFDSHNVESFSAEGGTTILFTPTGSRLGTPDVRQTPDITAVDGTNTSFFTGNFPFVGGNDVENDGLPNFFGTSAAAPHAAAIAALIKQANPGLSPQQIYDRITSTATDIGAPGVDNFTGYGLINAYAAIFGSPIQAGLNFSDSFETGALSGYWDTNTEGNAVITVNGNSGATDGTKSMTLGSGFDTSNPFFFSSFGFDAQSEATLHIDPSSATDDVFVSFDVKHQFPSSSTVFSNGSDDPMSSYFFGGENSDGVAFSVDGGNLWFRIVSLTGTQIDTSFKSLKFNLTQLATANGIGLGSDVLIRFQNYDLYYNANPITVDNVQVFTNQPPTVTLSPTPLSYPIGSLPINIDLNAVVQDSQTPVYNGGTLTVAVTQNGTSSDYLEIVNQALIPNRVATPNDITLSGNRVYFGGLLIGTYMGGSGASPLVVSFNNNATVKAVGYLLRDITFRTQSTSLLQRKVQVTLDSGNGSGDATASRLINIVTGPSGVNVAPTITLSPTSLNFQPGSAATVIDPSATVVDPDSTNFAGGILSVKISSNGSTTYDRIEVKNQGKGTGQISFSGSTIKYQGTTIGTLSSGTIDRTITLNASATLAAVQALVRNITFRTIGASAPLGTRTVQFKLTDGDGGTSLVSTKLINVAKKNSSPVIGVTTTSPTFHLGKTPVIIEPAATITDSDTTVFTGGILTVKITGNGQALDRLQVRNQGSNVGQIAVSGGTNILYGGILIGTISGGTGSAPLVITFNGNATNAAVRALTRSITFDTSGAKPSLASRTISFQLTDGQGGVSVAVSKTVKVSST